MTDSSARTLSPREQAAFELLVRTDSRAAIALCHPNRANADDLARAEAVLAIARAADAASNDGQGNRYAWTYAAWLARDTVQCGQQVAA